MIYMVSCGDLSPDPRGWHGVVAGDIYTSVVLASDYDVACRERDEEILRLRELLMDAVPCSSLTVDERRAWCSSVNEACDAHRAALAEREDT